MPRAILICGKICVGKSTYAEKIRRDIQSVCVILLTGCGGSIWRKVSRCNYAVQCE